MKALTKILILLILVLTASASAAALWMHHYLNTPPALEIPSTAISIPRGTSFAGVVRELDANGIIEQPELLIRLAPLFLDVSGIKAGEYRFEEPSAPLEVVRKLIRGEVVIYKVTIPEGFTIRQIARLLADRGLVDEHAFIESARNPEVVASFGLVGETMEGYLFPETYYFSRGLGTREILATLVGEFLKVFGEEMSGRAAELGLDMRQAATIASLIEKETSLPEERPLISAVIHNRLKRKIPLQMDPSVIYGIPEFDGNIRRRDLETPTPYNTYTNRGLPPTPIASPGRASLEAALHPADVDYLYFVSMDGRAHKFSRTLAEHNRAVTEYQKSGRHRVKN